MRRGLLAFICIIGLLLSSTTGHEEYAKDDLPSIIEPTLDNKSTN